MKKIIQIEGMHCAHCEKRVNDALASLENVKSVKVNLKKKQAVIETLAPVADEQIKMVIEKMGFEVTQIKE